MEKPRSHESLFDTEHIVEEFSRSLQEHVSQPTLVYACSALRGALASQPPIDLVHCAGGVYCGECIHFKPYKGYATTGLCEKLHRRRGRNHFCSMGEIKHDTEDV